MVVAAAVVIVTLDTRYFVKVFQNEDILLRPFQEFAVLAATRQNVVC